MGIFDNLKNTMGNLGDMAKMRQQAAVIQKALQSEIVVVEKRDLRIEIRGDQKVMKFEVNGKNEPKFVDAINEALQKIQKLSVQKLMELNKEG